MPSTRLVSILFGSLALLALAACGDDSDGGDDPPGSGEDTVLLCSDANSDDNQDMDGDGFSPCEGDCDDDDTAFYPDAPDADGDRIDHNCDNWMPERT